MSLFAEIAADLHLDQSSGILPDWRGGGTLPIGIVDRLVLVNRTHVLDDRHLSGARTTTQCSARWKGFLQREPGGPAVHHDAA